jgi:hypothetical protein
MKQIFEILRQFIRRDERRYLELSTTALTVLAKMECHPAIIVRGDCNDPAKDIEKIFVGHVEGSPVTHM